MGDLSRRDLVAVGAALAAGAVAAAPVQARAMMFPLYKAVFDFREPAGVAFAQAARAAGYATAPVADDVTALWYDDLYYRWLESPAAIAGLTSRTTAFCLQILAQDVGMRVLYRGEHRRAGAKREHALAGPSTMLTSVSLASSEAAWGAQVIQLIAGCSGRTSGEARSTIACSAPSAPGAGGPLVSWVLAPAQRLHT